MVSGPHSCHTTILCVCAGSCGGRVPLNKSPGLDLGRQVCSRSSQLAQGESRALHQHKPGLSPCTRVSAGIAAAVNTRSRPCFYGRTASAWGPMRGSFLPPTPTRNTIRGYIMSSREIPQNETLFRNRNFTDIVKVK